MTDPDDPTWAPHGLAETAVVDPAEDGRRLDQVLARRWAASRARVQRRLEAGDVRIDGAGADKSRRVRAGERIQVRVASAAAAPAPSVVPVRWRDDDLAVVAKPAGLIVHRGAGTGDRPTLVDALRAQGIALAAGDDPDRPGIVHRLDRGTSGLLVVASSSRARSALSATFADHDIIREYWALVDGVPDPPRATVEAPIARDSHRRTRFTVADEGRHAVTHYDLAAAHDGCAELDVVLETGRTHQVRVHLAAIGHPVAGDEVYGADPARARALGLARPALHARRLAFTHPVTGEAIDLVEPLPDDLVNARANVQQPR